MDFSEEKYESDISAKFYEVYKRMDIKLVRITSPRLKILAKILLASPFFLILLHIIYPFPRLIA